MAKRNTPKLDPNELVPHPYPQKGARKQVKRSYREYLIATAKERGETRTPAPIDLSELEPDPVQSKGKLIKPPKGYTEYWLTDSEDDQKFLKKLSAARENGETGIQWRYFSMDSHVYWVPDHIKP